jgi:lipoprotein-anchoring transpeptidase ErfK/SrfK
VKVYANPFLGVSNSRWLIIVAIATAASVYAWREWVPFRIDMPAIDGQTAVDPRAELSVEAVGFGTRLSQVELKDDSGKSVAAKIGAKDAVLEAPLEFGTHYTLTATAERAWLAQRQTKELSFRTVEIPKLEGAMLRNLDPESSVTLRFDQPVGQLETTGAIKVDVQPDPTHQSFKLIARDYAQGQTIPVELKWQTATGVPLPPLHLELATAPPLTAEINVTGKTELGLAMPVEFSFSEPLANRETAGQNMTVKTENGQDVPGKWKWYNKHRLHFVPEPRWPALSKIVVNVTNPTGLRSIRGGTMETAMTSSFTTGPDKRIEVNLAAQRATAIENGEVVKTFRISSGKAGTPTATGNFYIYARFPVKTMKSRAKPGQKGHYVQENVPYAQYFYDTYAFHGAWWHNGFGSPRSHGCVNMSTRKHNRRWPNAAEDAGWLYHWANLGVPVSVYRNAPSAQVAMQ